MNDRYRLPDATAIGLVRLQISDLARSLEYYTGTLGLRVLDESSGKAVLGPQEEHRPLVELIEQRGVQPVPRGGLIGLYHFAILLPDRAALGRFAAHLVEQNVRAASADHAVSEAVYLWDPDGLGIEVYADRPRTEWRVDSTGQLFMTTEPLDLRSVMAAGAGERWTGMPAATVMGHVHLHVGDLEAAAAFYHGGLGFDKTVWSYPGALFLSAGGYHHHLGTNTWSSGPPASDQHARLLTWHVVVPQDDEVKAVVRSLRQAGYTVSEEEHAAVAADPWGTRVRITTPIVNLEIG
jgi:catechol 2,3-dioxygenase